MRLCIYEGYLFIFLLSQVYNPGTPARRADPSVGDLPRGAGKEGPPTPAHRHGAIEALQQINHAPPAETTPT